MWACALWFNRTMRTTLLAPLVLLPLALGGCPTSKPPTVSLKACRVDADTALVSWWLVPRGKHITLEIPGAVLYEATSPTDEFELEAPIDGRTLTVTAYVHEADRSSFTTTDYELWATRYC